jgi:hypothetical protein
MALSPEAAREYVLKTEKLIIIDVRSQKNLQMGIFQTPLTCHYMLFSIW